MKKMVLALVAMAVAAPLAADVTGHCPEPAGGWKSRAIVMTAPVPDDLDRFNAFVTNTLAPAGVDTLVLLVRYRYQFKSHPECAESNALSRAAIRSIKAACDARGIKLVPKMNLLGHQGSKSVVTSGLLAAHPEFDETPEKKEVRHNYCRSICPKHPESLKLVTDLASEMAEAFGADMMHIGCDEVFEIGTCPRCKDTPTGTLFADWVNGISRHLKAKGVRTMIWSDRLLNAKGSGYGVWEASDNGTDAALGKIDKDVICCDWHYENCPKYPSVETLADAGYELYVCPWRYAENAKLFLDYAVKHDKGKYFGLMFTTWYSAKDVMDAIEGKWAAQPGKDKDASMARTLYSLGRNFQYLFPKAKADWRWFDGSELPMEGKGWPRRDQTAAYYERLPKAHLDALTPGVRWLQEHTTGMSFRFVTDSDRLNIRWKPLSSNLDMWHMPSTGVSGVDVYQYDEKKGWRYVNPPWPAPPKAEGASYVWNVKPNVPTMIYLPLYNGIEYFRLGIKPGCTIADAPARKSGIVKPVVFYGTSTTQGGCVSRPGLCWTSVAARLADVPQINLGFSGAGKMEDVLNDCLNEIDASCYVLDTCGNMDVPLLKERFEAFMRKLHDRKPGVPLIVPAHPWDDDADGGRQAFLRDLCAKLKAEDPVLWKDLHFLGFEPEFDVDNENTVEGSHMNDVGSLRLGTLCAALLRKVLSHPEPAAANAVAETWRMREWSFESSGATGVDVALDVDFTCGGRTMRRPAFWDGGRTHRVRFAPPCAGTWTWRTVSAEKSLDGKTGTFEVKPYAGTLEIYRRGFVRTAPGSKHFVYADGTPFLYLGDTHWGFGGEAEDDAAHPAARHVETVVRRRVEQGFTVWQSEPLCTSADVKDGTVDEKDVAGFRALDRAFQTVADAGLVHANAQALTPWLMNDKALSVNTNAFRRMARYWVARYGAYPVMWTLGQEVDNDFYHPDQNRAWKLKDNPYVLIAQFMHECDAYAHPLTAHQENVGHVSVTGAGTRFDTNETGRAEGRSVFADATTAAKCGHTWWGVQWSPNLKGAQNVPMLKDYWNDGRVAVNYEGRYCGLWAMDFGARAQTWISFLCGFRGHGYGAADLWLFNSTYDMAKPSDNEVEHVSLADKHVPWREALEFPSANQMIHFRAFMDKIAWWRLEPDFGDTAKFAPAEGLDGACVSARIGRELAVVYVFGRRTAWAGSFRALEPNAVYALSRFDPKSGAQIELGVVTATDKGELALPRRPDTEDWTYSAQIQGKDSPE